MSSSRASYCFISLHRITSSTVILRQRWRFGCRQKVTCPTIRRRGNSSWRLPRSLEPYSVSMHRRIEYCARYRRGYATVRANLNWTRFDDPFRSYRNMHAQVVSLLLLMPLGKLHLEIRLKANKDYWIPSFALLLHALNPSCTVVVSKQAIKYTNKQQCTASTNFCSLFIPHSVQEKKRGCESSAVPDPNKQARSAVLC